MKWMGTSARILAVSWWVLAAGCGGGSEGGSGDTPPPPPGIGAAGGTVTEASGAKVVIPAGALAANTDIQVMQSSAGAPALPANVTAVSAIFAFTPHGTTFAKAVTVTLPFDPTKLSAGHTPKLFKTDATRTAYVEVPGATVSGSTISADITSFSNIFAGDPLQLSTVRKIWFIGTAADSDNEYLPRKQSRNSGDFEEVSADASYGINLPFDSFPASSFIFSLRDASLYYLGSEAPRPGPDDAQDMYKARAHMSLQYSYRKIAKDAKLRYVFSELQLGTEHSRGQESAASFCPWLPFPGASEQEIKDHCEKYQLDAQIEFFLTGYSKATNKIFFAAGSTAELSGISRDWRFSTPMVDKIGLDFTAADPDAELDLPDLEVNQPVWSKSNFTFSDDFGNDGGSQGRVQQAGAVIIEVPLDDVPEDSDFSVDAFAMTEAYNRIQGESEAWAFMRDPTKTSGVSVEFSGLEPLPFEAIPSLPNKALEPCATGPDPAAGQVRFVAPDFAFPERQPARALIEIERVNGSSGEIGVRFETQDDTAVAGSDFQRTRRVVWFHDGQSGAMGVNVPIRLDNIEEPLTETANLKLTVVSGCAALGDRPTATLTIFDDDKPIPVTPDFALGGTVTGLVGTGLHLQTNFINDVSPTTDGPYTFPRRLDDGTAYSVSIVTQPTNPAQVCMLANAAGTIAGSDVTNVNVTCVTPPPPSGVDTGFGSQGKVFSTALVKVVAQQPDNKLLAVGLLAVTRYNADGTPDTSFGNAGRVDLVTGGLNTDKMNAMLVQPDGKILLAGRTQLITSSNVDFIVMRLNSDGTPDTSFGNGGKVVTDFDGAVDFATAMMLMSDGRIVVAGNAQIEKFIDAGSVHLQVFDPDFGVARYLPDGTLDTTFGTGGTASIDGGGVDVCNAAAMQPDGGIVAVGRTTVTGGSGNPDMAIVRFLASGTPDPAFGTGGAERIDITAGVVPAGFNQGQTDEAMDVAANTTGQIFVAGYALAIGNPLPTSSAAVFRLSSTGAIEDNVGPIPAAIDRVNGIALQGDGKIVIAGTGTGDFGIARFNADGSPDNTFGSSGLITIDFFGGADEALDVLIQSDGRIVAGGDARNGATRGAGLVRVVP